MVECLNGLYCKAYYKAKSVDFKNMLVFDYVAGHFPVIIQIY